MNGAATEKRRGFRSGTRLGRFSIGPLLARGGMGELYVARADGMERFSKLLAVKVLLPQLTDDAEFVEMFLHEARITARLDHPNIAAVTELGKAAGEYFLAIEYVHGRDLRTVLRESTKARALPLDCALHIVTRCCAGLHYAHTFVDTDTGPLQVVHRDITPSNIVVRYDGEVKIVDFGIAKASTGTKLTRTGTLKGKPGYMSPEQCLEKKVEPRSDIWGLGVLLYETTTGRKLFVGDNDFAIMGRVIRGEFPRPSEICDDYPPKLEAIVLRALEVDAEHRYESAQALQRELEDFAAGSGLTLSSALVGEHMHALFGLPPLPEVASLPDPAARRRFGALAVAGLGAAAVLGYMGWPRHTEPREDPPAPVATAHEDEPSPIPAAEVPPSSVLPVEAPSAAAAEATVSKPSPRRKQSARRKPRKRKPEATKPELDNLLPGNRREP